MSPPARRVVKFGRADSSGAQQSGLRGPVRAEANSDAEAAVFKSGKAQPGAVPASVLVVDDDPKSLLAIEGLLSELGSSVNVVSASSGEDALRRVLERDFAVIVLDARMPGIDGFATARLIHTRERSRHTPIIFLTGEYDDATSIFRGYEAGAVDYIVKPPIPEMLRSKISVFVDLYKTSAALRCEILERERVEGDLRASEETLRALAARLQSVREEESSRVAREIHEELGQALTGLKMDLTSFARRATGGQGALEENLQSMLGLIDDTIRSVKRIASRLRSEALEQLGLLAAIAWHGRDFQMRTGIRCKISLPEEALVMDPERSTAVFRVFQEMLTNVERHANATKVDVSMEFTQGRLELAVRDNGCGIAQEHARSSRSFGLVGMRERAMLLGGDIRIDGERGKGTCASLSVPLSSTA